MKQQKSSEEKLTVQDKFIMIGVVLCIMVIGAGIFALLDKLGVYDKEPIVYTITLTEIINFEVSKTENFIDVKILNYWESDNTTRIVTDPIYRFEINNEKINQADYYVPEGWFFPAEEYLEKLEKPSEVYLEFVDTDKFRVEWIKYDIEKENTIYQIVDDGLVELGEYIK